ncbi:putative alpha-mannosidase I [Neohortaea acidophila]|uniref:Alpha-mannosidase n=1 Tax=Neohortaea acidophila TaxID=245834 RepID=A0A6A6PS07_9PEZI|nr:putative alpha-mannosidase I [Neohortaea acidophila]KAF2482566.1 putative alpha-mannosidase I [Neohortaea acidophila]
MGGEKDTKMPSASSAHYPQLAVRPVGKQITSIYQDRLRQFVDGGQYSGVNLVARLDDARVSGSPNVKLHVWSAPGLERPTFKEATSKDNEFKKTSIGESFGPSWSTHWFELRFTVPKGWKSKRQVELHWDSQGEAMVWTKDGKPLQGLTGRGERTEWILKDEYREVGKEHTIYIEMACNSMFGNAPGGDTIQPPDPNKYYTLVECDLVSVNVDARALYYDFWIIGDAAREFPDDSWEQHKALQICNEIMDCFIAGEGSNDCIRECRKIAQRYLGDKIDSAEVYANKQPVLVDGIGNCHIDSCWLWPWAETKRKVARSWSTQCDMLDRYPEYRFVASQAQQFQWLEQLYPYAFDRVKSHVKEGTFQPIGGSWVEHDTNMPSGESLVRQFLYGQRYFESRFGQRCRTFWLPDTFGYSPQIPQICRLAGMNRFLTNKLSWNNINNFPHTTFNWVSLDGSQVICHMPPSETYTAQAHFGDVKRSESQHKSMDQDATSLLVYGKGDGGGGPTFEMLEKLRRCRGVSDTVGRLPRVHLGNSVEDFFDRLEKKEATGETELVTWYGELYFEFHRGTYTTQADNKKNNRKSEVLLHDLEYLATLVTLKGVKGYKYPKKQIDKMWEGVLLCQFHDCLPGSSIEMCYDDSAEIYADIFETGGHLIKEALKALGYGDKGEPSTLNTLSWERSSPATLEAASKPHATVRQISDSEFTLENDAFQISVEDGAITSLYDKRAHREVVPKGSRANQLVLFDDKPLYWQAWDVEVYHLRSRKELKASSTTITDHGPDKVSVTSLTEISDKSWVKTTLSLSASSSGSPIIETTAEVEWHETMKFLKVEFPVAITNTEASYETQFGIVKRPTHYNTSWDMAKFEVCCHKWADLSEHGYGVSVLNDSKYGFATAGHVMRLSLLRAPKAPDAHADMKTHHIRWAILPHDGALDERTVRAGYEFNYPPLHVKAHPQPQELASLLSAFKFTPDSSPSLVVDTVKRGEDDEDVHPGDSSGAMLAKRGRHVIVRVYESLGGRGRGTIRLDGVKATKAWKCNVLEDELEELEVGKAGLRVELRAFEVATYKLRVG